MLNIIERKKYIHLKNIYNKKKTGEFSPIIKEWNNSIYNYSKNKYIKTLLEKDKYVYKLFSSYFNLKKTKLLKKRKFSIIKTYISRQDIKHTNNIVYITLSIFNKEKISYRKYISNFYKKALLNKKKKTLVKYRNFYLLITRFLSNFNKLIYLKRKVNIIYILKYKKHYILYIKYLLKKYKKYKKLFFLKRILIKLKFINYKYNIFNFSGIKNVLNKIYSKKIELNIINLKYIYLDSNILTEAVGAKLKNRKANLLKNIIKSTTYIKIPDVNKYKQLKKGYILNKDNISVITNNNRFFKNDIGTIKDSIYIYLDKLNIALYKLNYKTIKGIKIQASGRLTKRLTALRSVSKFKQKGNLKNVYSSYNKLSTVVLIGYIKCNLQYIKKNYNNRNGSYGIKTYISSC